MSKPQPKTKNPDHPGQIKTMFVVEGNPIALLVIQDGDQMRDERMQFTSPYRALSWCRKHRSNFVYNPAVPNN